MISEEEMHDSCCESCKEDCEVEEYKKLIGILVNALGVSRHYNSEIEFLRDLADMVQSPDGSVTLLAVAIFANVGKKIATGLDDIKKALEKIERKESRK